MNSEPTRRQLRYLRRLADQTGTTFTVPETKAEASCQIEVMQKRRSLVREEEQADRQSVWDRQGGDQGVRDSEIEGYGSSARWA